MSFTPLPKTFTDFCDSLDSSSPRMLELGCGDGIFMAQMARSGHSFLGLDRVGRDGGTVADIVGDALAPPVAPGTLDVLVIPNLLRHLVPRAPGLEFVKRWLDLLKPGGGLFIFEDQPADLPPGAAHYRDLQEFLRKLMPDSRGPLISLDQFRHRLGGRWESDTWEFGLEKNNWALDAGMVVDMLNQGGKAKGEAGRLVKAIRRDGLDPGYFWWAGTVAASRGSVT